MHLTRNSVETRQPTNAVVRHACQYLIPIYCNNIHSGLEVTSCLTQDIHIMHQHKGEHLNYNHRNQYLC